MGECSDSEVRAKARVVDHILVAIDFGDASRGALNLGAAMAAQLDAKLTVLHVFAFSISGYGYRHGVVRPIEDLEREARAELAAATATAKAGWPRLECTVASGEPGGRSSRKQLLVTSTSSSSGPTSTKGFRMPFSAAWARECYGCHPFRCWCARSNGPGELIALPHTMPPADYRHLRPTSSRESASTALSETERCATTANGTVP